MEKMQKLEMKKWKLIVKDISDSPDIDKYFEQFGEIDHISKYPEFKIVKIQYKNKESAEVALNSSKYSAYYAWPQFKSSQGNQYIEIRNIPLDDSKDNMMSLLSNFGDVSSIHMTYFLPHKKLQVPVCIASFKSKKQRSNAISKLDGDKLLRKTLQVSRLLKSSPFHEEYNGDLTEFCYFIPIKGKHYIEFIDPPNTLDERTIRQMCAQFGHIYDVSILSKCKDDENLRCSHIAFSSKGPLEKALKYEPFKNNFNVRRLPKSSPYYTQTFDCFINDNSDED